MLEPGRALAESIDDFDGLEGWSVVATHGARFELLADEGRHGKALRLDFDFHGKGGYVALRKSVDMTLPENYAFLFSARARSPAAGFEFKLLDPERRNVWWHKKPDFAFSTDWSDYRIKKRMIEPAWGPDVGQGLRRVGSLEWVFVFPAGSQGSIWLGDLRFEQRSSDAYTSVPKTSASSSRSGQGPERLTENRPHRVWRSAANSQAQWILVDFRTVREYGGLSIDWGRNDFAVAYDIEISDDARHWRTLRAVEEGNGGKDFLFLPDTESRYLRLVLRKSSGSRGYSIRSLHIEPFEFSESLNRFFEAIAGSARRGLFPRYLQKEQSYFTVVGADGGAVHEGLLNGDGTLEVGKGRFSVEPFLQVDGHLVTWNEVEAEPSLEERNLPIPSVLWRYGPAILKITAYASGAGDDTLYARYRIENTSARPFRAKLFLALRPFQVNPSWQSLNMTGGTSSIHHIRQRGATVLVDDSTAISTLPAPDRFGAASFDQGDITEYLDAGRLPARSEVSDPFGYAGAALEYDLSLPPRGGKDLNLSIPFGARAASPTATQLAEQWRTTLGEWRARLTKTEFVLPAYARKLTDTLISNLGYVLIHRDGAALQPGSRTYARTWIRDGAMISSALLGLGYSREVKEFIAWYGGYQRGDGAIPCCVDGRGADSVAENDSHGEFVYAVAEYYRYTRDLEFVRAQWPRIVKAVDFIQALRAQRMTAEYRRDDRRAFFGLVPESISHEGYAAHPVHSYWDDFWTLRGLKDAAMLAERLKDEPRAARYAVLSEEFQRDLRASLARTMTARGLDYLPASVELADFDPNATAIAVSVNDAAAILPPSALRNTFDRWWEYFEKRRAGGIDWDAYTPYEVRLVEALVRLGRREQAEQVMNGLMTHQRPANWNHWAEIVWRDAKTPKFIGDMPHAWIGAEYLRALRSWFAYERDSDQALVLAAGIPRAWLQDRQGVGVKGLSTWFGILDYRLRPGAGGELLFDLGGHLSTPPGKLLLKPPLDRPLREVLIDGKPTRDFDGDGVRISGAPARVILRY